MLVQAQEAAQQRCNAASGQLAKQATVMLGGAVENTPGSLVDSARPRTATAPPCLEAPAKCGFARPSGGIKCAAAKVDRTCHVEYSYICIFTYIINDKNEYIYIYIYIELTYNEYI